MISKSLIQKIITMRINNKNNNNNRNNNIRLHTQLPRVSICYVVRCVVCVCGRSLSAFMGIMFRKFCMDLLYIIVSCIIYIVVVSMYYLGFLVLPCYITFVGILHRYFW